MRSIGKLRHRVTLQSPTETRTATGDVVVAWVTEDTVWAAVEPLTGSEYLAVNQIQNDVSVRIVIRAYTGVVPAWRVVFGDRTYLIEAVLNEDERNAYMQLMCVEQAIPYVPEDDFGFIVYDSDGNPFQVPAVARDSDGNEFEV